jgi:hypothetical protein
MRGEHLGDLVAHQAGEFGAASEPDLAAEILPAAARL